ncbi:type VI secretion system baseplate subunit TssE [Alkalimonas collagenimarina]|uniref:Type VI secretion system baseplate subunit TssE n=1 Tax=Alkalimonas collagenimarina TaxID=400390 RepID=A0ABT9H2W7_9GAMM|nr:type VI secretion system baseplate subunit TssE [Alkalimonas collagenimarina]MDP4537665.1 type VI secretion system baseplate subunit TssE [Alkalimonas collagenimarina]
MVVKIRQKQPLQQSLLDRLIDDAPGEKESKRVRRGFDLKALRASVHRDLQNLLNTRVPWNTWPEAYDELQQSLMSYGLPDFSVMVVDSLNGREQLCKAVEQAIRRFEPRFVDVEVIPLEPKNDVERVLRLRIQALLHADPEPEHVLFDSEVEPVNLGLRIVELTA